MTIELKMWEIRGNNPKHYFLKKYKNINQAKKEVKDWNQFDNPYDRIGISKGWRGESERHQMARYGIKTGRTKSGIVLVGSPKQVNAVLKLEKKVQKSAITPMPAGCNVWDVEGDDITPEQELQIWQHLVDTGQAWRLQGWYGRTAQALLDAGKIKYPKKKTTDYYGNPIPTRE